MAWLTRGSKVGPPPPDASIAKAGVVLDPAMGTRYQIVDTVFSRPGDTMYLARRLDSGATVELRVLSGPLGGSDELALALGQQMALIRRVSGHFPGIATVYECARPDHGTIALAAEHPEGPTLREVIRREGRLEVARAVWLAIQVAEVLERVHSLGLVHGGLRPESVFVDEAERTVTLTHFGFDRLLLESAGRAVDGADVGAADAAYRAPEQVSGKATAQSDVYAVGAILYEMLVGSPPPEPRSNGSRRGADTTRSHRPDISASLDAAIARALEASPGRRQKDISVLCNDLWVELSSAEGIGATTGGLSLRGATSGSGPRAWRVAALGACGGLAVTGALAVVLSYAGPAWLEIPWRSWMAPAPAQPAAPAAMATSAGEFSRPRIAPPDGPRPNALLPDRAIPASAGTADSAALPAEPLARPSAPDRPPGGQRSSGLEKSSRSLPPPARSSSATARAAPTRGAPPAPRPADSGRGPESGVPERREASGLSRRLAVTGMAEDPAPIIDWLLTEGVRQGR